MIPRKRPVLSRAIDSLTHFLGREYVFAGAVVVVLGWLAGGIRFGFGDTYQLIINTGTTIVTFVMVFAVQHTQDRDAKAQHVKLDAILRAIAAAPNHLVGAEDMPDAELDGERQRLRAGQ